MTMMLGPLLGLLCTAGEPAPEPVWVTHSLVSAGDAARLEHVLAKSRRGEPITLGVIGGSITQGARASKPEFTYGGRLATWWGEQFPQSKVTFVNAGIGATGSNFGALRARRDLLGAKPDLVVVEYAVNDPNDKVAAESLEGLLRQILAEPQQPAVVMFFMMHTGGGNAQEWHSRVGAHYHLPMVSLRDAVWPEMQAGHLKWEDMIADEVHPNDRGHLVSAQLIEAQVSSVLAKLPADAALPPIAALPEPLTSDLLQHTALFEAEALKPTKVEGWTLDAATHSWKSTQPGSVIEFAVNGRVIYFMDFHIRGPMGKARIQVDDLPPVVHDAWFEPTWGGYRQTNELARNLPAGVHRVRVELLDEKHPNSEGHEFRIMGLGAAGVTE